MTEAKKHIEATLLLPVTVDKIGLGLKKQKIGAGKLNGWGGVIDPGETPLACIVREVCEEGGVMVDPKTLIKAALMLFHNEKFDCTVHVYLAPWSYESLQETDEMGPLKWYDRLAPPLHNMMPADKVWLPLVLEGYFIRGEAWYGPHQETLENCIIDYVDPHDL